MEQCKQGGAQIRLAEEVHYSMGPANQDMLVAHIHGSLQDVGFGKGCMEDLKREHDRVAAAVERGHKEDFERRQALSGAEVAGKWGFEDEMYLVAWSLDLHENWIFESDEHAPQKGKSNQQWFCHLEN